MGRASKRDFRNQIFTNAEKKIDKKRKWEKEKKWKKKTHEKCKRTAARRSLQIHRGHPSTKCGRILPPSEFFFFVLVCTKLLLVFAFLLKHYLVRNKMAVRKRLARCKCVSRVRRIYFYQGCISFYNFVLVCLIFNFLSARLKI